MCNVRISESTHAALRSLADEEGDTIEEYRCRLFWECVEVAASGLLKDAGAWQKEMAERRVWDETLADGMDDE